ncbi:MAG: hypothetical protein Q4F29_09335 [Lachnospiraceae bacterium]|nr:hypothetical protein [Lachnospiraceae bacterium]
MAEKTLLDNQVDWPSFVARHNMKWSKKSCSWDSGAFLGNGILGTMIYSAEDKTRRNTLRCVTGRTDVEAVTPGRPGVYTRVPLGEIDVEMEGWIFDGTSMELDLYQAEFNASLSTTKGKVKIRSLVHSLEPVILIEAEPEDGESADIRWSAYPEIPVITKNEDGVNYNQYIPDITLENRDVSGVQVQVQRFWEKNGENRITADGCTVAWRCVREKKDGAGKIRFYLTILNGFGEKVTAEAVRWVKNASSQPVEQWIQSHRDWWSRYYQKSLVSVSDTRLEGFYLIQMYKLASATRVDKPIMDNQGPWMAATPWPRAWFNMNVQMAYSPVYTSNHLEIGESLCNALDAHTDSLSGNVAEKYRADSAGLGRSAGCNLVSPVEEEVGNLTWVLHNYWRQYRYSMDDARLKSHLYPLLKRSIQYYIHLLKEGEDGKLHLPKMISPEYGSFRHLTVEDSTYDLSLLRWGCLTLLKSCERLGIQDPAEETWRWVLEHLTDYHQDETGLMIGKDVPLAFGHRHFSHLLPIFPLHLISGDSKEEKELVHHCLRHWFHREGDLRGFTFSGAASLAAAIGAGDEALAYVKSSLHLFKPNTMYTEAGPVIESPLAVAEGINDMLLQSWGEDIRVFPAVPKEWPDVTIHGLRAEGGFLVSAVRRDGETRWIRVESLAGEPCRIRTDLGQMNQQAIHAVSASGQELPFEISPDGLIHLELEKGQEGYLYAGEQKPKFVIEPVSSQKHLENFFGENKPWRLYGIPFED